jgi:hypothetical protein
MQGMRGALWTAWIAACALCGCASMPTPTPTRDDAAAYWQALATDDLAAMRAAIVDAHPGAIDDRNPAFNAWVERGYREALTLVPRIRRYDDLLAVARYYTVGFLDGHLGYVDRLGGDQPIEVDGWHVKLVDTRFVVDHVMAGWPAPLPSVGATLLSCDGLPPQRWVAADIAPFVDRRALRASDEERASRLTAPPMSDRRMRRCVFRGPDGREQALTQVFRAVTWDEYADLTRDASHSQGRNGFERLPDGTLWVRAGNFDPGPDESRELQQMLPALAAPRDVRRIVFDTRGNAGGDRDVGARIFVAATGGLEWDHDGEARLPRVTIAWRVSTLSVETLGHDADIAAARYGADSESARGWRELEGRLQQARQQGAPWVELDAGPRLTRDEMRRRHAHLRRFAGEVALLTDEHCASACLDFADLVRSVPAAVHVGRTTSADAVYIDMGMKAMPSGNALALPLKVWRNRLRGNNEPLVPDVPLHLDLADDPAVQAAVLAALDHRRDVASAVR